MIKARIDGIGIVGPGSLNRQYKDRKNKKRAYCQISYTHRMQSKTAYVRSGSLAEVRPQIGDYAKPKKLIQRWVVLGIEYSGLSMKPRPTLVACPMRAITSNKRTCMNSSCLH